MRVFIVHNPDDFFIQQSQDQNEREDIYKSPHSPQRDSITFYPAKNEDVSIDIKDEVVERFVSHPMIDDFKIRRFFKTIPQ
jgi:hypothetical protein